MIAWLLRWRRRRELLAWLNTTAEHTAGFAYLARPPIARWDIDRLVDPEAWWGLADAVESQPELDRYALAVLLLGASNSVHREFDMDGYSSHYEILRRENPDPCAGGPDAPDPGVPHYAFVYRYQTHSNHWRHLQIVTEEAPRWTPTFCPCGYVEWPDEA